jgi:hypothetical protein
MCRSDMPKKMDGVNSYRKGRDSHNISATPIIRNVAKEIYVVRRDRCFFVDYEDPLDRNGLDVEANNCIVLEIQGDNSIRRLMEMKSFHPSIPSRVSLYFFPSDVTEAPCETVEALPQQSCRAPSVGWRPSRTPCWEISIILAC